MKNKIILIGFLLPASCFAQLSKRNVFLGGALDVRNADVTKSSSQTFFGVSTSLGYLITGKDAVGLLLGYNHSSGNYSNNSGSVGAFYQHYVPITTNFYFIGRAAAQVSFYSAGPASNDNRQLPSYSLSIIPSFAFFASKHWSFEAGVGRPTLFRSAQKVGGSKSSDIGFSLYLGGVNLAAVYYFNRRINKP